jgi:hypothetical protein
MEGVLSVSKAINERQKIYPNEPWLWNPEWVTGRILPFEKPGTITGSIAGYWVLAILVLGTFHLIPRAASGIPFWPMGAVFWGLGLLLGLFGFIALYLAIKRTRAWRYYGQVCLELRTNPAILGGKLRAGIRAATAFPADTRASLRLVCVQRSHTRSFVSGYTQNLWEASKESSINNGEVPVEFDLPADMPESDPEIPSGQNWFTWDLLVTVKSAAATFSGQFQLPVFKRR